MLSNYYRKKLDELLQSCKINLSSKRVDENLISNAFRFALDAHKNDKRASGEPYFSHPYDVALIVAKEIPLDDISVAAALLHDVVEDPAKHTPIQDGTRNSRNICSACP